MKIERFTFAHKNKFPIARFFGFLLILLILSLSIGATHGFAKDKKISGYVRTSSGNEISEVTITFSNGEGSTTTDSSGYYSQNVKEGWSGTATPSKAGYNFEPASRNYSNVKRDQSDQNYIGAQEQQPKTISGYVRTPTGDGINAATITFNNGGGTETTNSAGYYSHEVTYGWTGTVTPAKDGYSFDPASRSYNSVTVNQSDQSYIGTQEQQPKTISGYVRTSTGGGINGATITFNNGGGTETTNSAGYYSHEVAHGWTGTVTPAKDGYNFIPAFRNYNSVNADQFNQDYAGIEENAQLSIAVTIIGSGSVALNPDKDFYSVGSSITLTGTADSGWVFSEWRGDLNSSDNPESISISSDITITAIFLEDFDNDGVSDKEENSGPNGGDGNNDSILDSLQSNVSFLVLENKMDYVAIETPPGTAIKNCKAIIDPPNNNYPSDVEFLYGFFTFNIEDINVGGATLVTFYFPAGFSFNTYSKYGPSPGDLFDHWYEFIFDGMTGAEINESSITLHFVDGKRGDDDLTENGIIIDIGGPGIKTVTPPENDSNPFDGGRDSYGCFVEGLF